MRKKAVQAFDSRHSTMIENAFYYCNPPERQKVFEITKRTVYYVFKRKALC